MSPVQSNLGELFVKVNVVDGGLASAVGDYGAGSGREWSGGGRLD